MTAAALPTPDVAGRCDRQQCENAASWTLSYPDGRRRSCTGCLAGSVAVPAERLDLDDELAGDERGFLERNGLL